MPFLPQTGFIPKLLEEFVVIGFLYMEKIIRKLEDIESLYILDHNLSKKGLTTSLFRKGLSENPK